MGGGGGDGGRDDGGRMLGGRARGAGSSKLSVECRLKSGSISQSRPVFEELQLLARVFSTAVPEVAPGAANAGNFLCGAIDRLCGAGSSSRCREGWQLSPRGAGSSSRCHKVSNSLSGAGSSSRCREGRQRPLQPGIAPGAAKVGNAICGVESSSHCRKGQQFPLPCRE